MPWGFNKKSILVFEGDGLHSFTREDFSFETKAGDVITVPSDTETDGASVPQIFWNIIPPVGQYWLAAVLHDYLYRKTEFSKAYCDSVLLEAMEYAGVGRLKRYTIYWAVRLCGSSSFYSDRDKEREPMEVQ